MSSIIGEEKSSSVRRPGSSNTFVRVLATTSQALNTAWFWWILIVATCLSLFFPPSAVAVRAWDFLDSYVAYQHLRPAPLESLFRPDAVAERAANGLLLNSLGLSELNFISIIYSIFPQYLDTALQLLVQVLLLFTSTLAVLMRLLPASHQYRTLVCGATSFYFALLPISPVVVGSVIGANLILYGLLLIRDGASWNQKVIPFIIAPFMAQLPFGPIFYYPAFLVFALVWLHRTKRPSALLLLLGSLLLTIAIDYRLLLSVLMPGDPSHRVEWVAARSGNPFAGIFDTERWWLVWKQSKQFLLSGQGHYLWNPRGATTRLICLGLLGAALYFWRIPSGLRRHRLTEEIHAFSGIGLYAVALLTLLLLCFGTGILTARIVDFFALLKIPLHVNRATMVFAPIAAAVVVASGFLLVIEVVANRRSRFSDGQPIAKMGQSGDGATSIVACGCALILLASSISASDVVKFKLANLLHAIVDPKNPKLPHPTIAMYYESGLFDRIKAHLGPAWKHEKVVSIGIDPMIASVSGFQHLDGYFQSYPLGYKKDFRQIIAPEFAHNSAKKLYFDSWGSRIYIFADRRSGSDLTLNIDGCALLRLGATLVISRYRIVNPAESFLLPSGEVTGSTQGVSSSARLYRIEPTKCHGS